MRCQRRVAVDLTVKLPRSILLLLRPTPEAKIEIVQVHSCKILYMYICGYVGVKFESVPYA